VTPRTEKFEANPALEVAKCGNAMPLLPSPPPASNNPNAVLRYFNNNNNDNNNNAFFCYIVNHCCKWHADLLTFLARTLSNLKILY
jgi:hypothetical protein